MSAWWLLLIVPASFVVSFVGFVLLTSGCWEASYYRGYDDGHADGLALGLDRMEED